MHMMLAPTRAATAKPVEQPRRAAPRPESGGEPAAAA